MNSKTISKGLQSSLKLMTKIY